MQVIVEPFITRHAGDGVVLLGVLIAYLAYRRDSKKDATSRLTMHIENQQRLRTLGEFHEEQLEVNHKRDEQIHELKTQTATLGEIAKGLGRRLEIIEDR